LCIAVNYNLRPLETSFIQFIQKGYNPLLAAVALISGGMLLWPLVRRTAGGPRITTTQAIELINRQDALVVDVRDPGDFAAGHILGAKNLPLARVEEGAGEIAKKKERPLIVYDDGGERSTKAAAALKKQGFTQVANLAGGLGAWRQAGLPVEK
jgi:rhodanese-related sulfurtransferase